MDVFCQLFVPQSFFAKTNSWHMFLGFVSFCDFVIFVPSELTITIVSVLFGDHISLTHLYKYIGRLSFSFQLHRDHNFIAAMKLSIPSSFSNSKFSNIQRLLLVSEGPHALPGGKSSWEPWNWFVFCFHKRMGQKATCIEKIWQHPQGLYIYI